MYNLLDIDNVSLEELCRGICSIGHLSRVRRGERELNAVYFVNMAKRMYVSPIRFFVLIDEKEYDYFSWLETCNNYVISGKYQDLEGYLLQNRKDNHFAEFRQVYERDRLFYTYIVQREAARNLPEAYRTIKKSVNYMLSDEGGLYPGRYGIEELNRFMNYLELAFSLNYLSEEKVKKSLDIIMEMMCSGTRDPIEEAILYPRISGYIAVCFAGVYQEELRKTLILQSIEKLRKTSECFDILPLLEMLSSMNSETGKQGGEEEQTYQQWYRAMRIVYKIAEYPESFNRYITHDNEYQLFLIHEYLKRNRLIAKENDKSLFSQEKMSEGIMDVVNYRRNEHGLTRPGRDHFKNMTEKMGVSSDLFQGEIVTSYVTDFHLTTVIRHAMNVGDYNTAKQALDTLENHLDRSFIENAQFLDQESATLKVMAGKILHEEGVREWIRTLNYTIPYGADPKHIYSKTEREIIYKIIREKRILHLLEEEDIDILEAVLKNEEQSKTYQWRNVRMIKRLLAGILQDKGRIQECNRISTECIKEMIWAQDAGLLQDCVSLLAENYVQTDPDKSEILMKVTYWICDLYQNTRNQNIIKKVLQTTFEDISLFLPAEGQNNH